MQSGITSGSLFLGSASDGWPKEFRELKLIDDALKCGICYDYIKVCMVTPCAHSYCSICIRRSLLYKPACPSCFEETYENNLRNNRVLDRVTELFISVKDKLIKHLKIAAVHFDGSEQRPTPQKIDELISDVTPKRSSNCKKLPICLQQSTSSKVKLQRTSTVQRSSLKSDISKRLEDILVSPNSSHQANDVDCVPDVLKLDDEIPKIPSMFLQPKVETQGKVDVPSYPCPVCGVNIPERNMNTHLDSCLSNIDKPPVKSHVQTKRKRSPLKKMVWSLMMDKDLKKKLKEYGLNTQGDKKALISRLQRYTLLYNSECDSDCPRPVAEIVKQIEKEEKQAPTNSGPLTQQKIVLNKKTDPKVIEEENKKYIQENKDSFKKLIQTMAEREGRNIKPLSRQTNIIISDEEDEDVKVKNDSQSSKNDELNKTVSRTISTNLEEESLITNDDDFSSSPVLGGVLSGNCNEVCNGNHNLPLDIGVASSTRHSKSDEISYRTNKMSKDSSNVKKSRNNFTEMDEDSVTYSPKGISDVSSSPVLNNDKEQASDSDNSFSILENRDTVDDLFDDETDAAVVNMPKTNDSMSQAVDPDLVWETEDLFEDTEEVFMPKKRSKRKKSPEPSPRRTRRMKKQK